MRKSIIAETTVLLKHIENITYSIKMDCHNIQQVICMNMHATIIEDSEAALVLFDKNYDYSALLLVRSALESFAKLLYLKRDKEKTSELIYDYYKTRLATFNEIERNRERHLSLMNLFNDIKFKEEQDKLKVQCHKFKSNGVKPKKIKDIFLATNLFSHYIAIYRRISNFSHQNIEALEDRHVRVDEEGNKTFNCFTRLPMQELLVTFGYVIKIPYWSIKEIASFDLHRNSSEIEKIDNEVEKILEKYRIDEE